MSSLRPLCASRNDAVAEKDAEPLLKSMVLLVKSLKLIELSVGEVIS